MRVETPVEYPVQSHIASPDVGMHFSAPADGNLDNGTTADFPADDFPIFGDALLREFDNSEIEDAAKNLEAAGWYLRKAEERIIAPALAFLKGKQEVVLNGVNVPIDAALIKLFASKSVEGSQIAQIVQGALQFQDVQNRYKRECYKLEGLLSAAGAGNTVIAKQLGEYVANVLDILEDDAWTHRKTVLEWFSDERGLHGTSEQVIKFKERLKTIMEYVDGIDIEKAKESYGAVRGQIYDIQSGQDNSAVDDLISRHLETLQYVRMQLCGESVTQGFESLRKTTRASLEDETFTKSITKAYKLLLARCCAHTIGQNGTWGPNDKWFVNGMLWLLDRNVIPTLVSGLAFASPGLSQFDKGMLALTSAWRICSDMYAEKIEAFALRQLAIVPHCVAGIQTRQLVVDLWMEWPFLVAYASTVNPSVTTVSGLDDIYRILVHGSYEAWIKWNYPSSWWGTMAKYGTRLYVGIWIRPFINTLQAACFYPVKRLVAANIRMAATPLMPFANMGQTIVAGMAIDVFPHMFTHASSLASIFASRFTGQGGEWFGNEMTQSLGEISGGFWPFVLLAAYLSHSDPEMRMPYVGKIIRSRVFSILFVLNAAANRKVLPQVVKAITGLNDPRDAIENAIDHKIPLDTEVVEATFRFVHWATSPVRWAAETAYAYVVGDENSVQQASEPVPTVPDPPLDPEANFGLAFLYLVVFLIFKLLLNRLRSRRSAEHSPPPLGRSTSNPDTNAHIGAMLRILKTSAAFA